MQCIGIKGDVFHPVTVNTAGSLIGTPEVPLEHQLATACDQNRVHISGAREPISHPAQRVAVDELIVIDGGDGPAVVSHDRKTAAVGRAAYTGNAVSGASEAPPKSAINWRRLMRSSRSHVLRGPNVSAGICDLDLSSSALCAGDSRQDSLIAGFCHSQPVIRRALCRPGLSSCFRRGFLARECSIAGTLLLTVCGVPLGWPFDHVGCHASRSMRRRIWRNKAPVK